MASKTMIKLHENAKILLKYDNHSETLTHISNESKILIFFYSPSIYVNVSLPAEKVESEISSKLSRRISKRHLLGHVGKPDTYWRQANLS